MFKVGVLVSVAASALFASRPVAAPPPTGDCVMSIRVVFVSPGVKRLVTACLDLGSACQSPDPCFEVKVGDVYICDCSTDTDNPCCEIGYTKGGFGNKQPVGFGACPVPCSPPPCAVSFIPDDPNLPPPQQEGTWIAECGGD